MQTSTHIHMHAVKLLFAMMDDLTLYNFQMLYDIALVLGQDGMAQDKSQKRNYREAAEA